MKKTWKVFQKKPVFLLACVVCAATLITAGAVFAADTVVKSGLISEASAKRFAYLDAGVKEGDVLSVEAELEKRGLTYVYEIDFRTGKAEYSYEVRPSDGTVLSRESKELETGAQEVVLEAAQAERLKNKKDEQREKKDTQQKDAEHEKVYISVNRAQKVALDHAGLKSSEVTFSKTKLEQEDGSPAYEVEFDTQDASYEYEIDAYSGTVLESSMEEKESASKQKQDTAVKQESDTKQDTTVKQESNTKQDTAVKQNNAGKQDDATKQIQADDDWDDDDGDDERDDDDDDDDDERDDDRDDD